MLNLRTPAPIVLRFWTGIAAYSVLVIAVRYAVDAKLVGGALLAPVVLLPMLPGLLIVFSSMDAYRSLDELQRKITAEAILFAFAMTAVLTFSYGLLEIYGVVPSAPLWAVWPLQAVLWIIGKFIAQFRYR